MSESNRLKEYTEADMGNLDVFSIKVKTSNVSSCLLMVLESQ